MKKENRQREGSTHPLPPPPPPAAWSQRACTAARCGQLTVPRPCTGHREQTRGRDGRKATSHSTNPGGAPGSAEQRQSKPRAPPQPHRALSSLLALNPHHGQRRPHLMVRRATGEAWHRDLSSAPCTQAAPLSRGRWAEPWGTGRNSGISPRQSHGGCWPHGC